MTCGTWLKGVWLCFKLSSSFMVVSFFSDLLSSQTVFCLCEVAGKWGNFIQCWIFASDETVILAHINVLWKLSARLREHCFQYFFLKNSKSKQEWEKMKSLNFWYEVVCKIKGRGFGTSFLKWDWDKWYLS